MGAEDQGVRASQGRYQVVPRTLIFITHEDEVLLLKGAPTKKIWANRYNGVGGHVERDETVYDSALREIAEETGLTEVQKLTLRGTINIQAGDETTGIMLFVFSAVSPTRKVVHSGEGQLYWVDWRTIPPEEMADDLPILLPRVLAMGEGTPPFFARYWYDEADWLRVEFSG